MKYRAFLSISFFLISVCLPAQTLRMGADEATRTYYPVIHDILQDAGYEIELVVMPGGRSISNADSGNLDGEIWRVKDIERRFSNLLPVPTPIYYVKFWAYSLKDGTGIEKEEDLEGKTIAVMGGAIVTDDYIKDLDATIIRAREPEIMAELLESGRVDLVLGTWGFPSRVSHPESLVKLEPPLICEPIYIWFHKRHRDLLPVIDEVIKDWGPEKLTQDIEALID